MRGSGWCPAGAWCTTGCATGTRTPTSCAPRRGWRARPRRRSPGTKRCGRGTWATRTRTARSRDREVARRWLARTTGGDPRGRRRAGVTIGIHMEDLEEDRHLGPGEAAEVCDFLTMHGYPIYAPWSDGATDEPLVPFLARVTRWLGGGADVLFSEFGLPTAPRRARADAAAVHRRGRRGALRGRVLDGLRLAGCTGAMLWCYGDYDPRIGAPSARRGRPRALVRVVARGRLAEAGGRRGGVVRGRDVASGPRRRLDRHRRRPVLATAGGRAPAAVRALQGADRRLRATTTPVTARSRRPRAARIGAGVPSSRCDT